MENEATKSDPVLSCGCPVCGCNMSETEQSRIIKLKNGGIMRQRYRICRHCGQRYSTIEQHADRNMIQHIQRHWGAPL